MLAVFDICESFFDLKSLICVFLKLIPNTSEFKVASHLVAVKRKLFNNFFAYIIHLYKKKKLNLKK